MFFIKKLIFKMMEMGLGLNTYFNLETKNPIFINFKLSTDEAELVSKTLAPGFRLQKMRFTESDESSDYWLSYNFYEIKYPKKELASIKKVRCEINTFVTDSLGRKGIYVFSGSPFISRESRFSGMGFICDMAERVVTFIYGCGKLIPLTFELKKDTLTTYLSHGGHVVSINAELSRNSESIRLSPDYLNYNDISFFNSGKSFDLVHTNSSFSRAEFHSLSSETLSSLKMTSPFFSRSPDKIYYHQGEISYLVCAMNPNSKRSQA
jgi:hypothetical protein